MNCRTCIEFLMDYISGALPADERDVFEEHLRECPPCVVYLRQYEETVKLGKGCFGCAGPSPPGDMPEALVRAILAARAKSGPS